MTDDEPPVVEITSPAAGALVEVCEIPVTGTAEDAVSAVTLTLNGEPVEVAADGTFEAVVSLWTDDPGRIVAEARDAAGNVGTAEVVVEIVLPVLALTSPPPGALVGERIVTLSGSAGTAVEVTIDGLGADVADGTFTLAGFRPRRRRPEDPDPGRHQLRRHVDVDGGARSRYHAAGRGDRQPGRRDAFRGLADRRQRPGGGRAPDGGDRQRGDRRNRRRSLHRPRRRARRGRQCTGGVGGGRAGAQHELRSRGRRARHHSADRDHRYAGERQRAGDADDHRRGRGLGSQPVAGGGQRGGGHGHRDAFRRGRGRARRGRSFPRRHRHRPRRQSRRLALGGGGARHPGAGDRDRRRAAARAHRRRRGHRQRQRPRSASRYRRRQRRARPR